MCCFAPKKSRNGQFCISGTFVFLIFTTDLSFFYVFSENQSTQIRIKYITRRRQHPRSPPNLRDARRRLIENSLATKATLMSLSMKQLSFPSKARNTKSLGELDGRHFWLELASKLDDQGSVEHVPECLIWLVWTSKGLRNVVESSNKRHMASNGVDLS